MFYYLKTELIQVGEVPSKAPGTQEEINKCQVPFVPSCGVTCHLGWHNLTQSYFTFHRVAQREP